jgi:hypothetical protein
MNVCVFDWHLFAEVVTGIGTVGLVGVGAWGVAVATSQLKNFVLAEQNKATVEYALSFETVRTTLRLIDKPDMPISPAFGVTYLNFLKDPGTLTRTITAAQQWKSIGQQSMDDAMRNTYLAMNNAFLTAVNYFSIAGLLIRKGQVQLDTFVEIYARQILILRDAAESLRSVPGFEADTFLRDSDVNALIEAALRRRTTR